MNIKKLVSAVTATAMMCTSAFSLARNAEALNSTTLQPLETVNATAELDGYTDYMLKQVPLSALLDSMVYAEDAHVYKPAAAVLSDEGNDAAEYEPTEAVPSADGDDAAEYEPTEAVLSDEDNDAAENEPTEAEPSADGDDTAEYEPTEAVPFADGNDDSEHEPTEAVPSADGNDDSEHEPTEAVPSTDGDDAAEHEPTEAAPSADGNDAAEQESSAQAVPGEPVYKKGDKVNFAFDAKYVRIRDAEYSIFDENATIDLWSDEYAGEPQFTLNEQIIVSKAKQLSPTDIVYNVEITVTQSLFTLEEISFSYLRYDEETAEYDDTKTTINSNHIVDNSESDVDCFYYKTDKELSYLDDVFVEAIPSFSGKENVEYTLTSDSDSTEGPFRMNTRTRDYAATGAYTTLNLTATEGDRTIYDKKIYVYLGLNGNSDSSLYMYTKLGDGDEAYRNVSGNLGSDSTLCSFTCLYDNEPGALTLDFTNDSGESVDVVEKIAAGSFDSLSDAENAEDIKSALMGSGYAADYDSTVEFTVFLDSSVVQYSPYYKEEYVLHIKVTAVKSIGDGDSIETDFDNVFFNIYDVEDENETLKSVILNSTYDTYFKSHYQTVLVHSDSQIDMTKIKLRYNSAGGAEIYGANGAMLTPDDPQDFTGGTVNYTVKANGGEGNYPVTVKTNSSNGPELFVNGPAEREVFFDNAYGMYHNILIANLGDMSLEELNIVLSDAENVKLDGETPSTLGAFTTAYGTENLATIRLIPITDDNGDVVTGEISGTLTITAKDQEPVTIKLTGHAGNPRLIEEENTTFNGVTYVPFSVYLKADNVHPWNTVTYELHSGTLPDGLELISDTGEIYGAPKSVIRSTFTVEVAMHNSYPGFADEIRSYNIRIEPREDDIVVKSTDTGYDVTKFVGTPAEVVYVDNNRVTVATENGVHFALPILERESDQVFISTGEYDEFFDFWLNGEKLEKNTDYTWERGSTKITIKSQTLSKLPKGSGNTIAAEFRVDGERNNELRRAAQNFYIEDLYTPSGNESPDNSGAVSGSNPGNPGNPDDTNSGDTNAPDDTSPPDTPDDTAPPEGDIVFKPVPVDGDMAGIINGITVTAPAGTMSKDALLYVNPDGTVSADKGVALDFTFTLNGEKVQPSDSVTVRIPIPASLKGVTPLYVYHITGGKYESVDFWIEGDYVCFEASSFSTYIVSGKKLDSNGNDITVSVPGTTENPATGGVGIPMAGLVVSTAALIVILASNKKKH